MPTKKNTSKALDLKNQGNELVKLKQWQQALKKFNGAIAADSDCAAAWFNKGLMHKKLDQIKEASLAFKQALTIQADYFKAKFHYADCQEQLGNVNEAYNYYLDLISQKPEDKEVHEKLFQLTNSQGAFIAYIAIDLKLTNNGINILEFGNGMQSGIQGYCQLVGSDHNLTASELVSKAIQPYHPNCLLLSTPGTRMIDESKLSQIDHLGVNSSFDFRRIDSYKAVVACCEYPPLLSHILPVNSTPIDIFCGDKSELHSAFVKANLNEKRPPCVVIDKHQTVTTSLAMITKAMPNTTRYVIKIPDTEGGKGVVVVNQEQLKCCLNILATHTAQLPSHYFLVADELQVPKEFDIFVQYEHPKIMIEAYVTSKPFIKNKQIYDPTMRVMSLIVRDQGDIKCKPLIAYWKLPPHPVNAKADLRQKTISSYNEEHLSAEFVDDTDRDFVFDELQQILPKVFAEVMPLDLKAEISNLPEKTQQEKSIKYYFLIKYANTLGFNAEFTLAEALLKQAQKLFPKRHRTYHQLGLLYQTSKQHEPAIEYFTKALMIDSEFAPTYFRRAKSYFETGKVSLALQDCYLSLKHGYNQAYQVHQLVATYQPAFISEMKRFIAITQKKICTSHNLVNRAKYPRFYGNNNTPKLLENFKMRLSQLRQQSSELIAELGDLSSPYIRNEIRSLAIGTVSHNFVGSLVVCKFGIGDCGEVAVNLVVDLIANGYQHLAFIMGDFSRAELGMERGHGFVVVNVPKLPQVYKDKLSINEFMQELPTGALIVDPFLELVFSPHEIPNEFNHYIAAYGGELIIKGCMHMTNYTMRNIEPYENTADTVYQKILQSASLKNLQCYHSERKKRINDTSLLSLLNQKTELNFFAMYDEDHYVDAVAVVTSEEEKQKAESLRHTLKGFGRFLIDNENRDVFVLEQINTAEGDPSIAMRIRKLMI